MINKVVTGEHKVINILATCEKKIKIVWHYMGLYLVYYILWHFMDHMGLDATPAVFIRSHPNSAKTLVTMGQYRLLLLLEIDIV